MNDKDETLLFLRDDMPLWTNIGGQVDDGEDFLTALDREAGEEIGCRIDVGRFVGDFFSPQKNGVFFHEQVYMGRLAAGEKESPQKDEGVTLAWFHKDNLPANMGPRYRFRLEYAFANHPAPAALLTSVPSMIEFLENTTDYSNFIGMDEWLKHPEVLRKKEAQLLKGGSERFFLS